MRMVLIDLQETHSVTVATFGPTKDFPAFYSAKSGYQSPYNVETGEEAASLIKANESLHNKSGILFAVPIPASQEPRAALIQDAVDQAVRESEEKGIARSGKDVTPWLLSRVKELSKGSSVLSSTLSASPALSLTSSRYRFDQEQH
jgi:pseudouridine-5'-phosphate glycosidase/pseudouridine kinase